MVELVVVITAKLQSHNRKSDQIAPVPFKRAAFHCTYLGIKLFLGHDLGHVRVESNLHIVISARVIHEPRKETNHAYLFLGDRIHERLNPLEKGVHPPSEKITYTDSVVLSIVPLFGFSCRGKKTRTHGMLTTIAFPILSTYERNSYPPKCTRSSVLTCRFLRCKHGSRPVLYRAPRWVKEVLT